MDKFLLFSLVDSVVTSASVNKILASDIDFSKLKEMTREEFQERTLVKKPEIYEKLHQADYSSLGLFSIFTLTNVGISDKICQSLYRQGLTKRFMLELYPSYLLKSRFSLTEGTYKKLKEAASLIPEDILPDNPEYKAYMEELALDTEYMVELKRTILSALNEEYSMVEELYDKLPECYKHGHIIERAIDELVEVEYIENSLFGLKKLQQSLSGFLFSIPQDKVSLMLKDYLMGVSLERISLDYQIPKDRIKPTLAKYEIPELTEDEYFDLYATYYFTADDFSRIFGVDTSVFRYIELKSKLPMGRRNVIELCEDERISPEARVRVQNTLGKYAKLHGIAVLKTPESILDIYARFDMHHAMSEEELLGEFKKYWYSLFHTELPIDEKTFSILIDKSASLVMGKDKLRYYNTALVDYKFYSLLNLKQYQNVELSSKILYDANPMLMSSYAIFDEYELYHIMKKTLKKSDLEFGRRPMLIFGNGNRNNQIKSILFELSPISLGDFAKMYGKIFGVNEKALTSYAVKQFSPYYQDGVFTIQTPALKEEILEMYRKLLIEDCYFIADIERIANLEGIPFQEYFMNQNTISALGFKDAGRCIYRNTYASFKEYLRKYFTVDVLNLDSLDEKITCTVEFHELLKEYTSAYQYVEYETNKYISIQKLESMGITKEDILKFLEHVKSSVYEDEIFTITSLKNKGFTDPILDKELSDLFYASLCKPDVDVIYQKSFSTKDVLLKLRVSEERIGIALLISQILEAKYYMYMEDILSDLAVIYGIHRTEAEIKLYLSSTEIYQNPDSKYYYLNYETYRRMR